MDLRLKAQVTIEFLSLVVLSFMIFIVFSFVIQDQYSGMKKESEQISLKDITGMIQAEINTAVSVSDGYTRTFIIPNQVEFHDYTITVVNDYLTAESNNFESTVRIAHIEGTLKLGNNTLSKRNGVVYANQ